MRKNLIKVFLSFILIFGFFLRIVGLRNFPAGFTADEAAQGYTAFSILKTGKDEWGKFFPLSPRSFGDFKPPLYTYLIIPSIAIFDLNEFSVRLPAVIIGTFSILATYLLVFELFRNQKQALFSAILLVVSPWHFCLSRGAFEAALPVFFIPVGIYFFLRGLKKPVFLLISSIFFSLNLFSYHSARIFTPVFLFFLIFWRWQELKKVGRKAFLAGGIFLIFIVLAIYSTLTGSGVRAKDIGFSAINLGILKIFVDNYLSYFSPEFLFTQGPKEATYGMIPGRGVLYLFELPLLLFSFYFLIKKKRKEIQAILAWIFLAPLPASFAQGIGRHANRVALMMPAVQILVAYGLVAIFGLKLKYKKIIFALLMFWGLISAIIFFWDYFQYFPKTSAPAMSYGWREVMDYISQIENRYQRIIISPQFSEPQAFVAFYKKWQPEDFQKESQDWLRYEGKGLFFVDQLRNYHLGKYEFRQIEWEKDRDLKEVVFIGKDNDFPSNEALKKRIIPYPDGKPAFLIVER